MASASTRSRIQVGRVNEVARMIEETKVNEMDKLPLYVRTRGKTGYPNIEMKTCSVKEKSGFGYFCYTSGGVIKQNRRQLLLDIVITQES
jgi:hypothetical protein